MRRTTALITLLIMIATASACSDRYKMLGPEYGTTPPCDRPTYLVAHRGDFTPAQIADIASAGSEWGFWSKRTVVYMGEVDWKSGAPEQLPGTIIVERDDRWVGYSLPGKFVRIGPWMASWRSPSEPSYSSGATFRGAVLHELGHALVGAEDLYNEPGGNPGVIMGKGYFTMNKLALGDIKAAQAGGCK